MKKAELGSRTLSERKNYENTKAWN
jgi:hypothetical protein